MKLALLSLAFATLVHAAPAPPVQVADKREAFFTVERFGDPADQATKDRAAKEAFARNVPLWLDAGTAHLDINPTTDAEADTPESRHHFFARVCAWQSKCRTGNDARIIIRIAKGFHSVNAWNALGTRNPNILRRDPHAPVLDIRGAHVTETAIVSLKIGKRGSSDFSQSPPVIRYRTDYPLAIELEKPLPDYVVPGYAIGMKNITGDGDAEALSGAVKVETISADRRTVTTTVNSSRVAELISPTKLDTKTLFQGLTASRIVIPSACLGIDTSYTVEQAKEITGVVRGETTRVTVAGGHDFQEGQMVRFSAMRGMTELNGQQLIVAAPVTATEFHLKTLQNTPLDSRAYGEWTEMGSVSRVTELWTGGDYEGYFDFHNGARGETRFLGLAYVGRTGNAFAQELVMVADTGSRYQANVGTVLTGAGSRILRGAFLGTIDLNMAYCGGGGCQYAIGIQAGCHASVIRSMVGGARGYTISIADDSHLNVAASVVGGGSAAVIAQNRSFATFLAAKACGNLTGLMATGGSGFQIDASALIHRNTTGISRSSGAPGLGTFYGKPTFGTGGLANGRDANFVEGQQNFSTDAGFVLSHPESPAHIRHTGVLTANRAVTLSTRGAVPGASFIITRTGGGSFKLNVGEGPLKALAPNT
ncbi:MAG: hypothetical protein ABMA01_04680 [Chthoniobacteraceae bacterium]